MATTNPITLSGFNGIDFNTIINAIIQAAVGTGGNGFAITSSSNTITSAVPGVTLNLAQSESVQNFLNGKTQ